jgi:hypothetical protein
MDVSFTNGVYTTNLTLEGTAWSENHFGFHGKIYQILGISPTETMSLIRYPMADWDLELEEQQDSPPKRKTKSYGG